MGIELVGFGHVLYDLRCYVDSFPLPDKTSFIRGRIKGGIGGSATNAVCNAAKLGHPGAVLGKVGLDDYGRHIVRYLRSLKVCTKGLGIDYERPTGVSLVIVDRSGQPAVVESLGANEAISRQDLHLELIDGCKFVHLTGAPLKRLEEVAAYAKARGKMVSFDPGRSISRLGCRRLAGVLANCDLLMINRKEAAEMGGPRRLISALPGRMLVVKGGSRPTVVYDPHEESFVEVGTVPISRVVDTTGSGDAFDGGLLAKLLEGASLVDAVAYANACGALKATREGADGLPPHRKEVDSFFLKSRRKISIRKVKSFR